MKKNYTPHDVNIIVQGLLLESVPPSGKVARLQEWDEVVGDLDGVPLVKKFYGEAKVISREDFLAKVANPAEEPLPAEEEGVLLIVPMLVGQKNSSRADLIGPDFGIGGVRSSDGTKQGAVQWIKY